jgi:1-deoxy-D-xylulose-5-phosphate synthase
MAENDPKLVGITPAMREGSDLSAFSERFPDRYFDVAIAEQHAVTLAAGLACQGAKPVVAIYSTFLQRAYDQLIHDVAIQNLDVLFAIDRAGLLEDGPTHSGVFDLSYLRCVPNMIVMAPSNENEARQMLYTGYTYNGPAAVRYPRGSGTGVDAIKQMTALEIGKARIVQEGQRIALLSFGSMLSAAMTVSYKLGSTLVDMRFVKPLDEALIRKIALSHELIVTLEENSVLAGAGSAVNEYLASIEVNTPIMNLGVPDTFVHQDLPDNMLRACGLDSDSILRSILAHSSANDTQRAKITR